LDSGPRGQNTSAALRAGHSAADAEGRTLPEPARPSSNAACAAGQALKEIIQGNELFKQQQPSQADAFKAAQQNQSPETRQLVAALKG
jgi:hypothetical protein